LAIGGSAVLKLSRPRAVKLDPEQTAVFAQRLLMHALELADDRFGFHNERFRR
jgi:hypothetical protein